ncbi:glycosyltransferase family 2 protein [bacterium]|nr:glycosyltransferase family 2 protein [bacterium]
MNKLKKELLIVIVTYNSKKFINQCLSPFKNMPKEWEILVIDNKSQDDTLEIIKKDFPFVKIIESQNNSGFGAANNIGLSYALKENFEHVFLLNHDAYISVENLKELIKVQKNNPDCYIISPIHYDGTNQKLDRGFREYVKSSNDFIEDSVIGKYKKEVYEVDFVNAAMWLMNKKCIEEIGGFSPTFYHYGEDKNYTDRLNFHNKKCAITPLAKGVHDRAQRGKTSFEEKYTLEYREICIKVSNPNENFGKNIKKILRRLFKKSLNKNYFKLFLKVLNNKKAFLQNYKLSKTINANFLQEFNSKIVNALERERERERAS